MVYDYKNLFCFIVVFLVLYYLYKNYVCCDKCGTYPCKCNCPCNKKKVTWADDEKPVEGYTNDGRSLAENISLNDIASRTEFNKSMQMYDTGSSGQMRVPQSYKSEMDNIDEEMVTVGRGFNAKRDIPKHTSQMQLENMIHE